MANLRQVASVAGVSITTASRVLNRGKYCDRISAACADRVRAAALQVGYAPNYHARSVKLGRAETIGLVLEFGSPGEDWAPRALIGNSYYQALIGGIESATHRIGFALTLLGPSHGAGAIERGIRGLRERQLDGLLVAAVHLASKQVEALAAAPDAPIVVIQTSLPMELPVVDFDDRAGVFMAVRHLAELGHRNLLWVGPSSSEAVAHATERERHFMDAVRDAGLRGASCHFDTPHSMQGDPIPELAESALAASLQSGREFTGVVCYNDLVAIGAVRALGRAGCRVPEEVSVTGFDNAEAPYCIPALTTVDHRVGLLGQRAAEMLLQMTSGQVDRTAMRGRREIISPEFIERLSTGPAPRA